MQVYVSNREIEQIAEGLVEVSCGKLPTTLRQAITAANRGDFGKTQIPKDVLTTYLKEKQELAGAYSKAKKKAEYDRQTYFHLL